MMGAVLPICSIFFSFLLLCVFFLKKRIKLVENDVYSVMVICSFIDSILVSLLQIIASNGVTVQENLVVNLFNKMDFITLIFFCSSLFLYIFIITRSHEDYSSNYNVKKMLITILVVNLLFIVFMLCGNLNVISNNGRYSIEGTSCSITIFSCFLYIIFALFLAIINVRKADKRYIPIFSIIGILIFLIIVFKFNPYIIIISITLTFINYLMFFTIENPDVKMIKQLELARDQADKANRAKTDFLSSMSHEIRTPLNAITGFSDCVLNSNTLDEAKENAKDIITASNTLLEIVNGILDISKIEAGKLEIVNSPYDALELFSNLGKLIKPRMAEKGLDFQIYIAPDLPKILYGDHANIKKVVTNLLSNACKYTDRGYVRYDVNCVNNENSTRLIISVEDSGRGIKKDNIDKLFTKFQRLEEDRNTTIEGTGLGLAITKQLVELMGGKVVVHSIYGQGSKFTIILDQKIEKEVNIVKNVDNNRNNNFDLSGYRILIVDDNQLNLKVASKLLMRYNATIVCCESGFDCINLLKNDTSFDIILMDDMMPKMSGSETLHKIKQMPGINIPIIALTANAISGMREKYISDGFDDYLAKPIEKLELIRVFNDLVLCKDPISKSSNISSQKNDDIEQLEDTVEIPKIGNFNKEQFLRENGIDLDKALEFLGDMEMYDMTVKDYLSEIDNKITDLTRFKLEKDISNYAILVHSMKSDAKYLGLMEFASMAYKHELESKAGNISYVEENFEDLMKNLRKWLIVIKKYSQNI